MNLPMVLTATMIDLPVSEIISEGKTGIQNVKNPQETVETTSAPVKQTPEKPVSNEPFKIKNVRVDARGIHGQVATQWVPKLEVDRIIVIDDKAVKDDVQKMALKMAKPNSVKLSILSTKKAIERLSVPNSYPGEDILVIMQRMETIGSLSEQGYHFETINMGNVPNREGTKQYQNTVHLTDEEIAMMKDVISKGTHFTAQMVPSAAVVDFDKVIGA